MRFVFYHSSDFDAITDPIMKAKMVALKGINKVMVQNNMGIAPMVMNRYEMEVKFIIIFYCSVSNSHKTRIVVKPWLQFFVFAIPCVHTCLNVPFFTFCKLKFLFMNGYIL